MADSRAAAGLTTGLVVSAQGPASWANGMRAALPGSAAGCLGPPLDRLPGVPGTPATADELRLVAAFTESFPSTSRMPFSYQRVPTPVRDLAARAMGRLRRGALAQSFPAWPLDLSADLLEDLTSSVPPLRPTPVLLTHDLDSPEGLRNLVERFLPLEEAVGARSANYVVPRAWRIDHGLLRDTHGRGHEVGIHGFDHGNRTPFLSDAEISHRLDSTAELRETYDAVGYRAPSLLRTRRLLEQLAARFLYDSSIPTSGGAFPTPGNGCASARPFRICGIREIPLSLPRDGSLRFIGHSPAEILEMWKRCAEKISQSGGVVVLLTHCEARFSGNPGMLAIYTEFVGWIQRDERFVFSRPRDIASGD